MNPSCIEDADQATKNYGLAMRKQEIGWLLQNLRSRASFTERDIRRCQRDKPFDKARLEGRYEVLRNLISDLTVRQVKMQDEELGVKNL